MDLKLGDTQLIINECARQGLLRNQVAYVLATAYHESAHTMKPISEMGGLAYLKSKKYYPYFGRGYVQLTWDYNYKKAGVKLGVDFMSHPELLLQAQYAVPILVTGMREGWFTGRKLSDYMTLSKSDFVNARKMINGTDQANLIASYANTYTILLTTIGYGVSADPVSPVQSIPVVSVPTQPLDHVPVVAPPVAPVEPSGLLGLILMLIKLIFGGKK